MNDLVVKTVSTGHLRGLYCSRQRLQLAAWQSSTYRNQSINQSNNQSIDQPINQSITHTHTRLRRPHPSLQSLETNTRLHSE